MEPRRRGLFPPSPAGGGKGKKSKGRGGSSNYTPTPRRGRREGGLPLSRADDASRPPLPPPRHAPLVFSFRSAQRRALSENAWRGGDRKKGGKCFRRREGTAATTVAVATCYVRRADMRISDYNIAVPAYTGPKNYSVLPVL